MIFLASLTEEIKDKLEGYQFIKTKDELNRIIVDNQHFNKIIISRGFAQEYFTPSGLQEYIDDAKEINKNLVIEVDESAKLVSKESIVTKLSKVWDIEELIHIAVKYPKEVLDAIHNLTREDLDRQRMLLEASNAVARLQGVIDDMAIERENAEHALSIEQSNKYQAQSKLDALVKRINYQRSAIVDADHIFEVDANKFDKVLYFKEITRVQYTDTFLYYLAEIFKVLYNMPTRFVAIESYYAEGKVELYPNLVSHHQLKERDVLFGNILMLGFQPKLMQDILKNSSNVSLLIVLDRGGYKLPHLHGDNVEYFYIASDMADVPKGIPVSRVVSYNEDSLFIPFVKNFSKLDDTARMSKYSSMGITKRIISLVEGR